jgi:hypothetical protein
MQEKAAICEICGEDDQKAVYSMDDVLGALPVFRLWCNANRCTWENCPHQPAA